MLGRTRNCRVTRLPLESRIWPNVWVTTGNRIHLSMPGPSGGIFTRLSAAKGDFALA
jgi:hypothetical protein